MVISGGGGGFWGVCLWAWGGVCLWVSGCLPLGLEGCLPLGLGRGVYTPLGRHPQADMPPAHCILGYILPWTEFLTHACENITFPQLLLRPVKLFFNMLLEFFLIYL